MKKMELEMTGERLVTSFNDHYGTFEHLHRYAIARELAKDKSVLDIACGEGYGSNLIAQVAKKVVGVDISEEAISHASKKYQNDNLSFFKGSTSQIPIEDNSIDLVVSFETIEHHDEHEQMYQEISRVLKNEGILILSSPEKNIYKKRDPSNPFHIKEITKEELKDLTKRHFPHVEILHQRIAICSLITQETNNSTPSRFNEYDGNFYEITNEFSKESFFNEPFFNLVIASKEPFMISSLPMNSVFNSYGAYSNEIQSYKEEVLKYKEEILKYKESTSYKVGRLILYPIAKLKGFFKK